MLLMQRFPIQNIEAIKRDYLEKYSKTKEVLLYVMRSGNLWLFATGLENTESLSIQNA